MASSSSTFLLPLALLLLLLTPTSLSSQTCKSQKFSTPQKSFTSCTDLPHLSATLHWTFNSSASTLSMAYTASPPSSSGWVAWAINPTSPAMAGSQALLASKSSNGSLSVSTYNIQTYALPPPGPLSYKVSGLAGEVSGNKFTIFGEWQLPPKTESVIQVWQVGPSVTKGKPDQHALDSDNLASKGKLALTEAAAASSPAEAPAEGTSGGGAASPASLKNGGGEVSVSVGVWLGLVMGAFGFLF